jgi:hypothetical protein
MSEEGGMKAVMKLVICLIIGTIFFLDVVRHSEEFSNVVLGERRVRNNGCNGGHCYYRAHSDNNVSGYQLCHIPRTTEILEIENVILK